MLKGTGNYEPHPEGQYAARCVDVVTMYGVETQWGIKNMLRLVFVTDAEREGGKAWFISRRFNATIHPKSTLGQFLVNWRGRAFTKDELHAFDEESLVGAAALLTVGRREKDGEVYDQLLSAIRLPKGYVVPPAPQGFIRHRDKPENKQAEKATVASEGQSEWSDPTETDDLPF